MEIEREAADQTTAKFIEEEDGGQRASETSSKQESDEKSD